MKHNCLNCKWYRLNENISDEIGKHECYGYSLICSPACLGYEIEKENKCKEFEFKKNETEEEIRRDFFTRPFAEDKTTGLLRK